MRFNPFAAAVVVEAALVGSLFGVAALAAAIVLGLVLILSAINR